MRNWHWLAAWLLVVLLGTGLWIHRVHIDQPTRQGFTNSDLPRYFHPTAVFMKREIGRGHLALWNPYQMAGMPFLATHISGPLYPPNVVGLALLSPARALEAVAVFHLLVAGSFTLLLARRLKLGTVPSFAAAAAFLLSGTVVRMLYTPALMATCVWLPAVLWAVHGLVTDGRARWTLALGSVFSAAFLAGHAQGVLFEAQVGALYGLTLLCHPSVRGRRLRRLGLALGAGGIALGLSAVQLFPTLELVAQVPRAAEGLSLAEADLGAQIHTALLWSLAGVHHGIFSASFLLLPLLVCGWADRERRSQWLFFLALMVGALLFAMGASTPVFRLYHALPGGDWFRMPSRIAFVYALAASLLVAIGLQGVRALARRLGWLPRRAAPALVAVLALAVVADLYSRTRLTHTFPVLADEPPGAPEELLAQVAPRWREGRLFIENFGAHFEGDMPFLLGMTDEVFAVPTYEPMIPMSYGSYFAQDRLWRGFANVVSPARTPSRSRRNYLRVADPSSLSRHELGRLLDLMSVRFYTAHTARSRGRLGALERFTGDASQALGPTHLFERSSAVPRAYAVDDLVVEPDPERARARILSPEFDPITQAVVDAPLPGIEPRAGRANQVAIADYEGERVVLEASCGTDCLVVLTDLAYPGWKALVNGEPASILRVNTLFRGVAISAGTHRIEFIYHPASFRLGAALSVGTLAILAAGGALWWRRKTGEPDTGGTV